MLLKVSMANWKLTDIAKNMADECLQLHGGYGYMENTKLQEDTVIFQFPESSRYK